MAKRQTLSEVLRAAIERDGRSRYQLSKESGVSQGALSRFVNGQRDLTLGSADPICRALGLELKATKAKGR